MVEKVGDKKTSHCDCNCDVVKEDLSKKFNSILEIVNGMYKLLVKINDELAEEENEISPQASETPILKLTTAKDNTKIIDKTEKVVVIPTEAKEEIKKK